MKKRVVQAVGFASDGKMVLLGKKKVRIGKDKRNGPGGGLKPGETIDETIAREFKEECGLTVISAEKMGYLEIEQRGLPFVIHLYCFLVRKWEGELKESDEMEDLTWYSFREIPFGQMMEAEPVWLMMLLQEKKFKGEIIYDKDGGILKFVVEAVEEL